MYKGNKILAIIPARGGSKGIPKKNIVNLAGKPLILYTIESAKKSKYLDKFIVSTDDGEIATVSKKFGAEIVKRPEELAKDNSPTIGAIKQVINHFEEKFDIIVLLEPTSPLRKDNDIDNALKVFIDKKDADSLVSLGEIALENPYVAKIIEKDYVATLIKTKTKVTQRQQLPKTYFPYGVIYLSKTDKLLKTGTFYQKKTMPYFIERWQNYEIDDIYDLKAIEGIMKFINGGKRK